MIIATTHDAGVLLHERDDLADDRHDLLAQECGERGEDRKQVAAEVHLDSLDGQVELPLGDQVLLLTASVSLSLPTTAPASPSSSRSASGLCCPW